LELRDGVDEHGKHIGMKNNSFEIPLKEQEAENLNNN
jgi:hypothetical protein